MREDLTKGMPGELTMMLANTICPETEREREDTGFVIIKEILCKQKFIFRGSTGLSLLNHWNLDCRCCYLLINMSTPEPVTVDPYFYDDEHNWRQK